MKNCLIVLALLIVVCSCGPKKDTVSIIPGKDGNDGKNGHSLVSMYNSSSELECEVSGTRLDIYLDLNDSLSADAGDLYLNSLIACNGSNGLNGENGLDGTDGIDGADGKDGKNGKRGRPGERGPQGAQGLAGPQGEPGANGQDGENGADGKNGLQGPVGPQGSQGPQGAQGAQGLPGAAGSSGVTITSYTSSSCVAISGTAYYTNPNGQNSGIYTSSSCSSSSKEFELGEGDSIWLSSNILGVKLLSTGLRVIKFN